MIFPDWLASHHPPIPVASAAAVLKLADGGATVPFIARYRKEETGNLDEVAIRQVIDAKERGTRSSSARRSSSRSS
jgi:transcriptional accessory protein Tex/SPT6